MRALLTIIAAVAGTVLSPVALAKGEGVQLWLIGTVSGFQQKGDRISFLLTGDVELVQYLRSPVSASYRLVRVELRNAP
jgi:hypothetical protein